MCLQQSQAAVEQAAQQPSFRVEPLPGDAEAVRRLVESTGVFKPFEIDVAFELVVDRLEKGEKSDYRFLFADDGPALVGYICYGPITITDRRADIYWVVVSKALSGLGTGTRLIKEAERLMALEGMERVFVETSSVDAYRGARFFYRKNGYRVVSHVPDYYADGDDKVIFMKVIG